MSFPSSLEHPLFIRDLRFNTHPVILSLLHCSLYLYLKFYIGTKYLLQLQILLLRYISEVIIEKENKFGPQKLICLNFAQRDIQNLCEINVFFFAHVFLMHSSSLLYLIFNIPA